MRVDELRRLSKEGRLRADAHANICRSDGDARTDRYADNTWSFAGAVARADHDARTDCYATGRGRHHD